MAFQKLHFLKMRTIYSVFKVTLLEYVSFMAFRKLHFLKMHTIYSVLKVTLL